MTEATDRSAMKDRLVNGLAWKFGAVLSLQVMRVATAFVLARLLTPAEFGIAAMALVASALVYVFADLGLGAALIQHEHLEKGDRSTVFWITAGSGLVFTLLGVAVSPLVANFFGEPEVGLLFAAFSISFFLTSLTSTQAALMTREMDFRSLELRQIASYAAGSVVGISVAVSGFGAWAIIAQQLGVAATSTLLLFVFSPWRPGLRFSSNAVRRLGGFGAKVFGARFLFYLNRNVDNILIGRFIGPAALGVYAVSYNVMLMPFSQIAGPVQEVMLPALARSQAEPARLASMWLRANRIVASVTIPAMLGLMVVAPEFVLVVLGDSWAAAIPIVRVLAWVGLLQSLQRMNGSVLQARNRARSLLVYAVVVVIASVIAFVVGLPFGIFGVAIAYAISSTFVEPYYTWVTARAVGIGLRDVWHSLAGVVEAAVLMTVGVTVLKLILLDQGAATAVRLAVLVAAGIALYIPLCSWRSPEVTEELRLLRRRRGSSPPGGSLEAVAPSSRKPAEQA